MKMKIRDAEFTISAVSPKQYPKDELPEIVLVGKSNVGKSSYINTLTNRKRLARTSSTPGKTRQINFYKITADPKNFYFVDLPGYGFSKMSKEEKEQTGKFIEEYLLKSKKINAVIFLIDIRYEPTEDDKLMYRFLVDHSIKTLIVANKADKIAVTKVASKINELQEILNPLKDIKFMPFSSERRIYSDNMLSEIETML